MDKSPLVLLDLVERLGNLIRAELRRAGAEQGLQVVHLQALVYLHRANRYSNTPQALAEFLHLTKGTMSQSLLLLDRRGLIERYEDEVDRRVVRLRLSPLGEQVIGDTQHGAQWQEATSEISANRIRNGVSALRETLFMLQIDNGGRTFGVCHTCGNLQRESQRVYRCGVMGDRVSGPETRRICREHSPKSSEQGN
ncbi:MAG: winged helix-turn-helix transcriptional regulator [Burkholderiales bacterium]|nr:winged helix-turn-helix transcriptional regulator [Burkholderiales bacterium]